MFLERGDAVIVAIDDSNQVIVTAHLAEKTGLKSKELPTQRDAIIGTVTDGKFLDLEGNIISETNSNSVYSNTGALVATVDIFTGNVLLPGTDYTLCHIGNDSPESYYTDNNISSANMHEEVFNAAAVAGALKSTLLTFPES